MRRLWKQPTAWMVAAELVVVGTLVGFAWHEVAGAGHSSIPLVLPSPAPEDTSTPDVPADALAPPTPGVPLLVPGLNVDPAFWRQRLTGLNAAEAQFEALEWRIIHSALETVRRYVETVVIPAVEGAEKRGGRREALSS